ncbi:MAG: 4Fe-4S dicluster domain-containing protein [Bacillota bacterium]
MKRIVIEPEKCTGCRDCELACSMTKVGEFNPMRSLIRAVYFPEDMVTVPVTCLQCDDPLCMDVCPANAIKRDPETGAVVVNSDRCIGCYMCASVCPVGALKEVPGEGYVTKCDLCEGDPACVDICATGALSYEESDEFNVMRSRKAAVEVKKVMKKGVESE